MSKSEGWPKVISEALINKVIPVVSDVGAIPHIMDKLRLPFYYNLKSYDEIISTLIKIYKSPELFEHHWLDIKQKLFWFTYEHYLKGVKKLFKI